MDFLGGFLLRLDLKIFMGERGDKVKFYMRVTMYVFKIILGGD